MSDRNVVATPIFVAGIMLGAFTVQLKDQLSLGIGGGRGGNKDDAGQLGIPAANTCAGVRRHY